MGYMGSKLGPTERLADHARNDDGRQTLTNGIDAAREVVEAWEDGDLAGAVNALSSWAEEAATDIGYDSPEDEA